MDVWNMALHDTEIELTTEHSLCLLEGMEGFEGVNFSDDSSILALLDDLQGEKVALFDNDFITDEKELCLDGRTTTDSHNDDLYGQSCFTASSCTVNPDDFLNTTGISGLSGCEDEQDVDCAKRIKLDSSEERNSDCVHEREHTVACVMHDHCYTSVGKSCTNSDEEVGNEDGSGSDGGYDTMSASTSPGNKLKKSDASDSTASDHSPVPTVDPVALIDARIQHYMCAREVNLTEEEKETLKAEGLPIPTTLPLTKVEEKALRNVRRKLRNKVAAQESRKRKKEFVQCLEEKVSTYGGDNVKLQSRVKKLESENRSLKEELKKLRALLTSQTSSNTRVGTYIMVIILCFAVFYGGLSPSGGWNYSKQSEYSTASVRSRSLLSTVDSTIGMHTKACNWFRYIFMWDIDDSASPKPDKQHHTTFKSSSVIFYNVTNK